MVSFHPVNGKLNASYVWTLRSARHGTQEAAVKQAKARSSNLCCSGPLWAARSLGPGCLCPPSLAPQRGHHSLGPHSCLPRWAARRWGKAPDTSDLSPLSPARIWSAEGKAAKSWGLATWVNSFFHLVSSQSIHPEEENPFSSMSYSTHLKVSLSV